MLEYSYKVNKWNEAGDGLNWEKTLKKTAMVPIHGKRSNMDDRILGSCIFLGARSIGAHQWSGF